jgi:hypothetical protein
MEKVKLFIYIPTFNRPDALKRQLMALLPQVKEAKDMARVLINDNNSDYDNRELLDLCSSYKNIEYKKNFGNIGANANISLGFIFARPDEFIWILSDNDTVKLGAIKYILENINLNTDFYCFVDGINQSKNINHHWSDGWQKPMNWRMGLISDALYNANTVNTSIDDAFFYHNSSFPHLAVACSAAKKRKEVNFTLLPRDKISTGAYFSSEIKTDYSLAAVCMPFLVSLFPKKQAKNFCLSWIIKQWFGFYENRSIRNDMYVQSKAILKNYGGIRVRVLLTILPIIFILYLPIYKIKNSIIKILKEKLDSQTIDMIKKFLNRN